MTEKWLKQNDVEDMVNANELELREAIKSGETAQLLYLLASRQEVSGATVGYTSLCWLSMFKYGPTMGAAAADQPMLIHEAELTFGISDPGRVVPAVLPKGPVRRTTKAR